MSPLAGPDLFTWMALRRVHGGHVAKLGSRYLDAGRPVPCFLPAALDDLITAELVILAEPDPMASGMRRVTVTEAGRTRYEALCRQERQSALRVLGLNPRDGRRTADATYPSIPDRPSIRAQPRNHPT